jgi:hypothetical protein
MRVVSYVYVKPNNLILSYLWLYAFVAEGM